MFKLLCHDGIQLLNPISYSHTRSLLCFLSHLPILVSFTDHLPRLYIGNVFDSFVELADEKGLVPLEYQDSMRPLQPAFRQLNAAFTGTTTRGWTTPEDQALVQRWGWVRLFSSVRIGQSRIESQLSTLPLPITLLCPEP